MATADAQFPGADIDWHRVGWGAALLGVGGDLVTTVYGLQIGLTEQNPFVVAAISEFGILALFALKIVAISWVIIIGHFIGRKYGTAAAFGLAIPQLFAVAANTVTIVGGA